MRVTCPAICSAVLLFTFFSATGVSAATKIPALVARVNDFANVPTPSERSSLEGKLSQFETETSHQMVVLTIESLDGQTIEAFSRQVANSWRIGKAGVEDGILIVVAMNDRRVRIELGIGMAKLISDATAQSIINDAMVPEFRGGRFAVGIDAGVERLMREARKFVVKPETSENKQRVQTTGSHVLKF